jgi:16S rRNA (uracil1498-N3)-methyltransferase
MTLPLYLTDPGALATAVVGSRVDLTGPEARHAVTVRRTAVGDQVLVADGAGVLVTGAVLDASPQTLTVVVESIDLMPEPSPRFVLVQALAKNDRDDQAIEAATELGVDEVIPWQADRSIVQWRGERGEKARRKWDQVLLAATKQSRRSRRPLLGEAVTTTQLAGRIAGAAAAYLLLEHASEPLAGLTLPSAGEVFVIVGPEGGVTPRRGRAPPLSRGTPRALGEHRPAIEQRRPGRARRPERGRPLALTVSARSRRPSRWRPRPRRPSSTPRTP